MRRIYSFILWGLIIPCATATAQGREVPVEVVVDKLSYRHIRGFLERTTEAVYRFYHDEIQPGNYIADKGCLRLVSHDVDKTDVLADDPTLAPFRTMKPFMIDVSSGMITIRMESFEDDKGDPCGYDKGDDNYTTASLQIRLSDLDPGVFSTPYTMAGKDGKMSAEIRVRYGIPLPAPIKHKESLPINNVGKVVELESLVALENKKNLTYQWEFHLEGSSDWKLLGENRTISESVVFYPIRDVLKTPIKRNQVIQFRMKAVSKELSSEYVSYEAKFTPEAPELITANAVLGLSCPSSPTGTIAITEVKTVADQIAYYIVAGKKLEDTDQPDVVAANKKIKWGSITNGNLLKVEGLAAGDYTLVVHNAGMEVGTQFNTYSFAIAQYPVLTIKSSEVKEATCSNTPDGQLMIETEGGNPAKFISLISPAVGKQQQSDRLVVFSELFPGTYTIVIKDACGQLVTKDMEVPRKIALLKGQLAIHTEAINEFANGSVNVSLSGSDGKYKYTVLRNNSVLVEKETSSPGFVIDRLAKGTYQLKVVDLTADKCPGWDTVFTMTAKTILADSASNKDTGAVKSNNASWNAMVTPAKVSNPDIRRAVFAVSAAGKEIASFAAYIKTGPAQKRYYLVIEKSRYELKVFNALDNTLIVTYPVVFGSSELDMDKLTEGDRHTPEGEFRIIEKRPHEKWDKFLALDFPNEEAYNRFNARKAAGEIPRDAKIGSEIGIHGTLPGEGPAIDRLENWTMGCISTKNEYINELYQYIPVGTKVIIKK